MSRLSLPAFREALSASALRQIQIVHLAIPAGALLFAVVTLALSTTRTAPQEASGIELVGTLSLVHAFVFLSTFPLALLLPRSLVARGLQQVREAERDEAQAGQRALNVLRAASIVRLALLEGAALLGVIVCLLGGLRGVDDRQPLVWLNLASTGVLLVVAALTFPSRGRLEELFREHARL